MSVEPGDEAPATGSFGGAPSGRAARDPARSQPRRVLLVCTGNLCRSPMAAALLSRMLEDAGLEDLVTVGSAGIAALDGQSAAPLALEVAGEAGLDLARHRSRAIDGEMMRGADLIVTMEQIQRQSLAEAFPSQAGRIHLLSALAGEAGDVADPYGTGSSSAYQACLQALEALLEKALPRILSRLGVS